MTIAVLRRDMEGEACWSPVVFLLPLKPARERKRREKLNEEGVGRAPIAMELRRDALIAPSGCGQYRRRRKRGVYSAKENSFLPDVVIGPQSIYYIHTLLQETDAYARESPAGIT